MRVEDPAWEDLQKPLAQRYYIHGDNIDAWATGYLVVEKVLKGQVEKGAELPLQFHSRAPSGCSGGTCWEVGGEGIWLLKKCWGGKWWAATPYARVNGKLEHRVIEIMKAVKSEESLEKYRTCGDVEVWSDLFEKVIRDKKVDKRTFLRWLVRMPAMAYKGGVSKKIFGLSRTWHFLDRVSQLSKDEILFTAFVVVLAGRAERRCSYGCATAGAKIFKEIFGFGQEYFELASDWRLTYQVKGSYMKGCCSAAVSVFAQPEALDEERSTRLKAILKELSADEWRVREAAQKKLEEMIEDRGDASLVNALLEAQENGDPEQKHRINLALSPVRETTVIAGIPTKIMRLRTKLLPNLAFLLSPYPVYAPIAKRLKNTFGVKESVLRASLEERTGFVLKALEKLYPPDEKGKVRKEKGTEK